MSSLAGSGGKGGNIWTMKSYDFIVLGGGSAGYAAARTAVELGLKTAVVEGGARIGGLCILRGCMPTKSLLETAHRVHEARQGKEFGIQGIDSPQPSWKQVVNRKDRLIREFAGYRQKQLLNGRFDFFRAMASFSDPHTLELRFSKPSGSADPVPQRLRGKTFLIATGSRVSSPPIEGLEEVGYLTSDEAIHLKNPPRSLTVLGGGPIAVEFADYFHKMGLPVSLIQRSPYILKGQDDDVGAEVENAFRASGMKVFTGTKLLRVTSGKQGKTVAFEHEGKVRRVHSGEILNALGRDPATEGLGLEAAGITKRKKHIQINRYLETSQPHIFAAGDVSGPYEIVHVAIEQGETAARNAAGVLGKAQRRRALDYRVPMEIIFCHPEVASVGLTEKVARQRGIDYAVASYPFNDHGKSMIMGAEFGFVKCLADRKNGRLIGAHIVGPHASDLIHEFSVALTFRATVERFLQVPHYHPTLAEIVTYPVEELAEKLGRI